VPEAHVSVAGNSSNHKGGCEKEKWKGKEVSSQKGKSGFEKVTGKTS
jgi:hypothetical protein